MLKFVIPLFLVLIFVVAGAAQSSVALREAVMVDSFGRVPNGQIRFVLDGFAADIMKRGKGTRGVVVNYGTVREVDQRKRLISDYFTFRGFDGSLISYVRGGNVSELRTDLWIVPAEASPPQIKPEAFVAAEFGRVTRSRARAVVNKFFAELKNLPDHRGYIIVYGTEAQMTKHEKWILAQPYFRSRLAHDEGYRVTFVRGGRRESGIGTVMWIVPPGAADPTL